MRRNAKIRIVSFLLAVMTIGCVACASPSDDSPSDVVTTPVEIDNETTVSGDPAETTPAETELTPDLPQVRYDGETFTFLEREIQIGGNVDVYYWDIHGDIGTGDTMSSATYTRNMQIIDKYGIEIESVRVMDADIPNTFSRASDAGEMICDVLDANGEDTMNLAIAGYLRDMNTIDYIDYEKPWWMGMVMDTSSIAGKNAFAIGDHNAQAFIAVSATYFNKQLILDLGLDDPYQLVKDGKWTQDMFYEYCQKAVSDLDGDGAMTMQDRYGLIFNAYVWQPLFYGSGKVFIDKDSNDMPFVNLEDEHTLEILAKSIDILADDQVQACTSWTSINQPVDFQAGHSLFWVQLMYATLDLRQGDLEFGILPMPKYDESQEEYYHYIHNKSSFTAVPKINQDLERTGIILEDMAYYSYKTVRPDFFDIMLDGKVARDEESWDMLDIIYENVYVCLLRPLYNVVPADTAVRAFIINKSGSSVMASTLARSESLWKRSLDKVATAFDEKVE